MKQVDNLLLSLVRKAINDNGEALTEPSVEDLNAVLELAGQHSLTPLVLEVLLKHNLISVKELAERLRGVLLASVVQEMQQSHEQNKISEIFEQSEIPHIHLKGSVMRNFYPKPWQRTRCDVDVLVKSEDLEKARHKLEENGYKFYIHGSHDVSMFSPSGIKIELHYHTIEKGRAGNSNQVLDDIWSYAKSKNDRFEYVLFDEMFYFYHVAHMAKHFENGGCGVRSFIDLWILNHKLEFDPKKRAELLKKGNLLKFAKEAEELSEIWLSEKESNPFSDMLSDFILSGGVYGNLTNFVKINQQKKGGKLRYILWRIFLPYDILKFQYPILKEHKILLPIMQICRWVNAMFRGRIKKSIIEMNTSKNITIEQEKTAHILWKKLGL